MIAILEAKKAGLLKKEHWLRNLVSGVIVGVVALPLAMAFAIASGAKPEQGIYTAIVAGVLVSVLGGTRVQIAGPTGAFIVILAGITAKYGIDGLQVATLMAGVILLLLGFAKFGSIIKFIPSPVIVGFTAGIGVIIWVGQWQDFLGLPRVTGTHFHEKLLHLIEVMPQLHFATTGLALLGLILVLWAPRLPALKTVPGPLTALLVTTALQAFMHFNGVATIGTAFGGIPQALPVFHLPTITVPRLIELIGPAFTIAILGSIESLLSAVVADGMTGTRHDSNQELIGQGFANIVAPLMGGFAATGAIARTATGIRNGGNSPLTGIVHAATLVLIILLLAPLAAYIPLCVLAAILFVVAWNMSEVPRFISMVRRAPKADVAILLVTFFLTVFADLVIAVNIGVILASLLFMQRMAGVVEVKAQDEASLNTELRLAGIESLPSTTMVYAIEGPLFFGAVEHMQYLLAQTHTRPDTIIFRLRHVPFMDITGLQSFESAIRHLQQQGTQVLIAEANMRVLRKLKKIGLVEIVGREHLFSSLADAAKHAIDISR
jgi:SulP family sulfate permease